MLGALWLASCGALGDSGPDRDWPPPSPALWKATGPNGERAWLFGTIHALPDGVRWRTPELDAAIAEADLLMVEISDLEGPNDAADAFEYWASGNNLPPLLERVPPEARPDVAALIEDAGREERDFHHFDSWAAALMLGNALRCSDASNGVDRALLREFDRAQSTESFDLQFRMFDSLPDEAQADLLVTVAEERDCSAGEARMLAWLTGDTDAMLASVETGFRGNADLRDTLLVRRNDWFTQRLARYQARFPHEAVLLAVGAAHLPGPDGVAAMLEREGYTVRRIQ